MLWSSFKSAPVVVREARLRTALLAEARRHGRSDEEIRQLEAEWPAFLAHLRRMQARDPLTDDEADAIAVHLLRTPSTSRLMRRILWPAQDN